MIKTNIYNYLLSNFFHNVCLKRKKWGKDNTFCFIHFKHFWIEDSTFTIL